MSVGLITLQGKQGLLDSFVVWRSSQSTRHHKRLSIKDKIHLVSEDGAGRHIKGEVITSFE
jgi:hypothetical protein